jgi:hypothetical protein
MICSRGPRIRLPSLRTAIVLGVILVILVLAAVWVARLPPPAPSLELLALSPQGGFAPVIDVPFTEADDEPPLGTGAPRVPIVLGLLNSGSRAVSAGLLDLSVPSWLHLHDANGQRLVGEQKAGNPLVRYRLHIEPGLVEPGATPVVVPPWETIGIEFATGPYVCTLDEDGLPSFARAPEYDTALLGVVQIFYAIARDSTSPRRTGLLTLRLDPTLAIVDDVPEPVRYPIVARPDSAAPDTTRMERLGARDAECGEVDRPFRLRTTSYATVPRGTLYALSHDGTTRSILFDLDDDGVLDAEIRDANGDRVFEAGRRLRMQVPAVLLPLRVRADTIESVAPSAHADSMTQATRDTVTAGGAVT